MSSDLTAEAEDLIHAPGRTGWRGHDPRWTRRAERLIRDATERQAVGALRLHDRRCHTDGSGPMADCVDDPRLLTPALACVAMPARTQCGDRTAWYPGHRRTPSVHCGRICAIGWSSGPRTPPRARWRGWDAWCCSCVTIPDCGGDATPSTRYGRPVRRAGSPLGSAHASPGTLALALREDTWSPGALVRPLWRSRVTLALIALDGRADNATVEEAATWLANTHRGKRGTILPSPCASTSDPPACLLDWVRDAMVARGLLPVQTPAQNV